MYRIFIISIVIACFTTITLGSNVGHLYKFNDWLMKNNSDYRYGCEGSVSKNMYFVKYCYDKDGHPLWENDKNIADDVFSETVDYLTIRELIKNIDHLYNDPINNYIPIPSAILIANMYARWMNMENIDHYI